VSVFVTLATRPAVSTSAVREVAIDDWGQPDEEALVVSREFLLLGGAGVCGVTGSEALH
jgi:hypothetical protein